MMKPATDNNDTRDQAANWPESMCVSHAVLDDQSLFRMFEDIIIREKLPDTDTFKAQLLKLYLPMAGWLASQHTGKPIIIGVNGAQGSGKSTLCTILENLLVYGFKKNAAVLSIDDLYMTLQQRETLSKTIHPLLKTRGVPGTHDTELWEQLFTTIKCGDYQQIHLPRFDKSIDDRKPREHWQCVEGTLDILLFEGWCVGAQSEADESIQTALNSLESDMDSNHIWRRYVNDNLKQSYASLFNQLDQLIMLKVPSLEKVKEWRKLQEHKLRQKCEQLGVKGSGVMDDNEIERFIMHYERITRHCLDEMPGRADIVMDIDDNHMISRIRVNQGSC